MKEGRRDEETDAKEKAFGIHTHRCNDEHTERPCTGGRKRNALPTPIFGIQLKNVIKGTLAKIKSSDHLLSCGVSVSFAPPCTHCEAVYIEVSSPQRHLS